MKKITLLLCVFLISTTLLAQNIVGNVKRGPYLIAELSFKSVDTTTTYKLRYLDSKFDILKSIEFDVNEKFIDELYNFFTKILNEKNGFSEDIQIGKFKLNATSQKMMGIRNIIITIDESSNFGLNGKEINKLFGK
jgi:hypothetical protein